MVPENRNDLEREFLAAFVEQLRRQSERIRRSAWVLTVSALLVTVAALVNAWTAAELRSEQAAIAAARGRR